MSPEFRLPDWVSRHTRSLRRLLSVAVRKVQCETKSRGTAFVSHATKSRTLRKTNSKLAAVFVWLSSRDRLYRSAGRCPGRVFFRSTLRYSFLVRRNAIHRWARLPGAATPTLMGPENGNQKALPRLDALNDCWCSVSSQSSLNDRRFPEGRARCSDARLGNTAVDHYRAKGDRQVRQARAPKGPAGWGVIFRKRRNSCSWR
jgi:hypothetical protein